ncbi:MAG: 2-hydroxyacyl-CoA dehydratase [Planctomycetaceae bacterium]
MALALFDAREGMGLGETLGACRDLVTDPGYPTVRAWREGGGKVVGHFQVYFPEELAHAAGMLPVKVRGAPVEAVHAEARFGSYLCSILKTSLELALSGRLELDLFVSHPICDAARNLAAIWGRNFPYPCQVLYLPQNPNSAHSATYLREEYVRLLADVEAIAGRRVTPSDLERSIAVFNENRRLLRDLYELRRERPELLAVDESYALVAVGGMVPREEHSALLRRVLPMLRTRPARRQDRIRVTFEGGFCEQPPLDLLTTIARSCHVVDDDLLLGLRWLLADVEPGGDPLGALARAYVDASATSPVQHDLRKPKERMLLERARAARADAVIVTAAKMCEPGLEEQVAYTRALDEAGIPYFVGEFQESMTSFEHFELQLETFVENILFA